MARRGRGGAMRKSRFSEEQIIAILKESEGGVETGELCRRHGITRASFYRWKSKYGGLELSEARRLKQLEEENRQLKHIVAEQTVDIRALKAVLAKSGEPASAAGSGTGDAGGSGREPAPSLRADGDESGNVPLSQTASGGGPAAGADAGVGGDAAAVWVSAVAGVAAAREPQAPVPAVRGREAGLRRKRGRKRAGARQPLQEPTGANQVWSVDFVTDALSTGRRFRTLNIVDDYTREAVAIEVDTSLGGLRVVPVLEELKGQRGLPTQIRSDNGQEFTSRALDQWAYEQGLRWHYIQP